MNAFTGIRAKEYNCLGAGDFVGCSVHTIPSAAYVKFVRLCFGEINICFLECSTSCSVGDYTLMLLELEDAFLPTYRCVLLMIAGLFYIMFLLKPNPSSIAGDLRIPKQKWRKIVFLCYERVIVLNYRLKLKK